MPIYEYVCEQCGEHIEIIQKITDPPASQCPKCLNHSLKKKTSISAFHLKGSGWYKDGYNGASPSQKKDDSHSKESETTSTDHKKASPTSTDTSSDSSSASTSSAAEPASTAAS